MDRDKLSRAFDIAQNGFSSDPNALKLINFMHTEYKSPKGLTAEDCLLFAASLFSKGVLDSQPEKRDPGNVD